LKEAVKEVTEKYTEEYFKYIDKLRVKRANSYPKATEHIPEMIALVKGLMQKGYAYTVDGDVFFSVRKFPSYGKLSGRKLDEMKAGARVEVDEKKKDPLDFVLWKKSKEDEPSWESPWGNGRPGWHIECSAMSMKYLGESFDIHGGGQDLTFPHHENEIAQSEACTGKQFARYWLHNGFVTVDKEKMSKSLGNFFTLEEILEQYEPQVVRLFLISTHYRHPIDFNNEELEEAKRKYERLTECDRKLKNLIRGSSEPKKTDTRFRKEFETHMDNDFNTPGALAVIFDMMKYLNSGIGKGNTASEEFTDVAHEFVELREVLGLTAAEEEEFPHEVRVGEKEELLSDEEVEKVLSMSSEMSDSDVEKLIMQRELARRTKEWEKADKIRSKLSEFVRIQDTPDGTLWRRL
jgi:cysteinyl-tRNA synthetase